MRIFVCGALLFAACRVDLSLSSGLVDCTDDADCPSGMSCRAVVGRCVADDSDDVRAPALVGTAGLSRTVAKPGDVVLVTFTTDEDLALLPSVSLSGPSARSLTYVAEASDEEARTYVFSLTASADDPEDGPKQLTALLTDLLGNQGTVPLAAISFDKTPPTLVDFDFVLESGKVAARADDVLTLSGSAEAGAVLVSATLRDAESLAVLADVSGDLGATSAGASVRIEGDVSLTGLDLANVDAILVELELADVVGNILAKENARTAALPVDVVPPLSPSASINGGAPSTLASAVTVALDAVGATEVFIGGDDILTTDVTKRWLPISLPTTAEVLLTFAPGEKTVQVRFRDGAFNESAPVTATITLEPDFTPPVVVEFTLVSPDWVASREVSIAVQASDNLGVAFYQITESATPPAPASFTDSEPPTQFTLSDTQGPHTLYAWALDVSGIISGEADPIVVKLDTVGPVTSSVSLANGASSTTSGLVALNVSATDAGIGLHSCYVTLTDSLPAASSFQTFCPASVTLPDDDGVHTVYVFFRDLLGNASTTTASSTDTILLDRTAPLVTIDADAFVDSTLVPLNVIAEDPGAPTSGSGMGTYFVEISGQPIPDWAPHESNFTLTAPPTEVDVQNDGLSYIKVWARDVAGNIGGGETSVYVGELRANEQTSGAQARPRAAMDESFVAVAFESGNSVCWRSFGERGVPAGGDHCFTGTSASDSAREPDFVVRGPGDYLFVWTDDATEDVYAQPRSASTSLASRFRVNTSLTHVEHEPTLARQSNGDVLFVWTSDGEDGDSGGIYARLFDATLFGKTSVFRVNTTTSGDQHLPAVAAVGDGYVVVWESSSGSGDVLMQRIDATGQKDGNQTDVSSEWGGAQHRPAVAVHASGTFAIAWEGTDLSNSAIRARLFSMDGTPVTDNFDVNVTTDGSQSTPAVAFVGDELAVVWQSYFVDSSGTAIVMRRFDITDGTPTTGEQQLNYEESFDQTAPTIAADARGVAVFWESLNQDFSDLGIYGRFY